MTVENGPNPRVTRGSAKAGMSLGPVFHGFSSMADRSVGRKGFLISEAPSLESETKGFFKD
jgi:hypothetical protein